MITLKIILKSYKYVSRIHDIIVNNLKHTYPFKYDASNLKSKHIDK